MKLTLKRKGGGRKLVLVSFFISLYPNLLLIGNKLNSFPQVKLVAHDANW